MGMLLAECQQCHTLACIATQMMPCKQCGRAFARALLCVEKQSRRGAMDVQERDGYEAAIGYCATLVEQRLGFNPSKTYVKETIS